MWSLLVLLALVSLQLTSLLAQTPTSGSTTCNFSLVFPNASFPSLGEVLVGSLTYNNTANPITSNYSGYPLGHDLLSFTGTRTVWQATAAAPTTYASRTTTSILGLYPVTSLSYFANNSVGPYPIVLFGEQLYLNQTLPNGQQGFFFFDNLFVSAQPPPPLTSATATATHPLPSRSLPCVLPPHCQYPHGRGGLLRPVGFDLPPQRQSDRGHLRPRHWAPVHRIQLRWRRHSGRRPHRRLRPQRGGARLRRRRLPAAP